MTTLVINAGSSSLKFSLFDANLETLWSKSVDITQPAKDHKDPNDSNYVADILAGLWNGPGAVLQNADEIKAVGHRVVHGGAKYAQSVVIDDTVVADLKTYIELDPTHELFNIQAIEAAQKLLPQATHVAVFDTGYHHDMPLTAQVYAVPYDWYSQRQIRRFGFHGINHRYCVQRVEPLLAQTAQQLDILAKSKIITCHLGSGGSLCASLDGHSQMTTMGYTPLEGLVMRTRSGSIDPGIIFALLSQGEKAEELYSILNKESGLKGISGLSGDMREIEKAIADGHERAQLAFDIYNQNLASAIASLIPVLGGLDALVFSGGIGEHSSAVRKAVCDRLGFAGIFIDPIRNEASEKERDISAPKSAVRTFVIAAGEEIEIATECRAFVS